VNGGLLFDVPFSSPDSDGERLYTVITGKEGILMKSNQVKAVSIAFAFAAICLFYRRIKEVKRREKSIAETLKEPVRPLRRIRTMPMEERGWVIGDDYEKELHTRLLN